MLNYLKFTAADEIAAAFGAVLRTRVVAPLAAPNHRDGVTSTGMNRVFGQLCRPRKIPL